MANRFAALATKLINKNGRTVTFVKFDQVIDDPAKPWDGPDDARTGNTTESIKAVFVQPASAIKMGLTTDDSDLAKRAEQVCLVTGEATNNLNEFDEVVDTDSSHWKIDVAETLIPGPDRILYVIGLTR